MVFLKNIDFLNHTCQITGCILAKNIKMDPEKTTKKKKHAGSRH